MSAADYVRVFFSSSSSERNVFSIFSSGWRGKVKRKYWQKPVSQLLILETILPYVYLFFFLSVQVREIERLKSSQFQHLLFHSGRSIRWQTYTLRFVRNAQTSRNPICYCRWIEIGSFGPDVHAISIWMSQPENECVCESKGERQRSNPWIYCYARKMYDHTHTHNYRCWIFIILAIREA